MISTYIQQHEETYNRLMNLLDTEINNSRQQAFERQLNSIHEDIISCQQEFERIVSSRVTNTVKRDHLKRLKSLNDAFVRASEKYTQWKNSLNG